jgi:hypothetical protein
VTQQNAALVEEAAAAAESLEDQAKALAKAVSMFRIDGGSSYTPPASIEPRAPLHPKVSRLPERSRRTGAPLPKVKKLAGAPPASNASDEWEEF